jgi:hemolysin activation/secretion protein
VAAPLPEETRPLPSSSAAIQALACAIALSLLIVPVVHAQEGLRRQEERARQLIEPPPPGELKPQPAPQPSGVRRALPPDESPCFPVTDIVLQGPDARRFAWLQDAALPYLRQCVGVEGLNIIMAALNARLQDAGYATTRVSLPPHSLAAGTLDLHIEAGRVDRIEMSDANWGTWRNAFPIAAGDVLDVHAVAQGLAQMKRLPSQRVASRLEAGDSPGSTRVVLEREPVTWRERLRGSIGLDNAGSAALGRSQLSFQAALDNPLGLNDIVSVALSSNAARVQSRHRAQSASLNYSVPWGYSTFSASASSSRFAQTVRGTSVDFLSSGVSHSSELRWDYTLLRTASTQGSVHAAVSSRRAQSYLDDTELIVQRRRTTQLETGASVRHAFARSSLDLQLGYRRGMPWNAAQDDLPAAASGGPTLRPHLWLVQATWEVPPGGFGPVPLGYTLQLRGQSTRDRTLATDQIAIGSRYTVRGFDGDAVLMAENGLVLRNEFTLPAPGLSQWSGAQASWVLAVDWGRVGGPSADLLPGRQLAGLAAGLRLRGRALHLELLVGTPLRAPEGFSSRALNAYATTTFVF